MQNKVRPHSPAAANRPESGRNRRQSVCKLPHGGGLRLRDGSQDGTDLSDFLVSSVQDQLSRVSGVGEVTILAPSTRCASGSIPPNSPISPHPGDVTSAIEAQNSQVSAGQLGGAPGGARAGLPASITARAG